MIDLQNLKGKKVVILGLGKNKQGSGVAAAKWALRNGLEVLITDKASADDLRVTLKEI